MPISFSNEFLTNLLKNQWHIERQTIEALPHASNPFRQTLCWKVNDHLFLKASKQKGRGNISNLLQSLAQDSYPVLNSSFPNAEVEDWIFSLSEYLSGTHRLSYDGQHIKQAKTLGTLLGKLSRFTPTSELATIFNQTTLPSTANSTPILQTVQDLLGLLPYFETRFSHGDFHPQNILWTENTTFVLDWEQAGWRPELYDLAFFLGCAGLESRDALLGPWTEALIAQFTTIAQPTKLAMELLPELILLSRLEWLPIWQAREEDAEVVQWELNFWEWLIAQRHNLRQLWLGYANTNFYYTSNRWVFQDNWMDADIKKAKERLANTDIFSPTQTWQGFPNKEQLSTDLRLLAIDYGVKEEVHKAFGLLNIQTALAAQFPDSEYIQSELMISMGNSCLDCIKFKLYDALFNILAQGKRLLTKHQENGIAIGYACMLRNSSIGLGEANQLAKSLEKTQELIEHSLHYPHILEIKEELARALSNAIVSLLKQEKEQQRINDFFSTLEFLNTNFSSSHKITGAYKVAVVNMKK